MVKQSRLTARFLSFLCCWVCFFCLFSLWFWTAGFTPTWLSNSGGTHEADERYVWGTPGLQGDRVHPEVLQHVEDGLEPEVLHSALTVLVQGQTEVLRGRFRGQRSTEEKFPGEFILITCCWLIVMWSHRLQHILYQGKFYILTFTDFGLLFHTFVD